MSTVQQPRVVADRYRLVQQLGQGGMGRVWLAHDDLLHRDVAIKEIVPPAGLTPAERQEMRERTLREARAIARLSHPNVVRVFDVLSTDGDPWIVMEYVRGRSLQEVLATDGPVPPARAADIGLGVLAALRAAHRAGVLHRDVKPGNVLLGDDGRVVLTDFGLATVPGDPVVTRTGLVLGSPAYLAPERARDGSAGPEADLWSLGATLYAAVEGQSPYARPSAIATLAALATEPPAPAKQAGPMRPTLNGLLRKNPADRISPAEVERLLLRAAGPRSRTVPGRAMIPAARMKRPPKAATVAGAALVGPGRPTPDVQEPETAKPEPQKASIEDAKDDFVPVVPDPRTPSEVLEAQEAPPPDLPARKQRTWWWAAAAVGVVLAVILVVAAALASRGDPEGKNTGTTPSERPGGAGAAVTSAGPSNPPPASQTPPPASPTAATGEPAVPSGWRYYQDPTGFKVAVPEGWAFSRRGTMVYFREPNGRRVLGIDQTDQPKPNPVADWKEQEQRRVRAGDWAGYQQVKIVAVDYFLKAADWEFTYASNGGRTHVINRGFVTSPNQAYGLYWSTPDSDWDANLANFRLITQTFRPRS